MLSSSPLCWHFYRCVHTTSKDYESVRCYEIATLLRKPKNPVRLLDNPLPALRLSLLRHKRRIPERPQPRFSRVLMHISLPCPSNKLTLACAAGKVRRWFSSFEASTLGGEVGCVLFGERGGGDVEDGGVGLAAVTGLDSVDDCKMKDVGVRPASLSATDLGSSVNARADAPSQCQ